MTIKELNAITERLIAQGHEDLDVCVEDRDKDMVTSFEVKLDTGKYYKWVDNVGYEGLSGMFLHLDLNA
jgi:hypothetical protein